MLSNGHYISKTQHVYLLLVSNENFTPGPMVDPTQGPGHGFYLSHRVLTGHPSQFQFFFINQNDILVK